MAVLEEMYVVSLLAEFCGSGAMQIQYKKTPWWQRTFSLLCTLGTVRLLKTRTIRLRPGVIDETGIELINGPRFTWSQFKSVHNPLAKIEDAEAERLVLFVDDLAIPVNFDQMVDGTQTREYFWSQWPVNLKSLEEDLPTEIVPEGST